jgi:hypothetical protein
MLLFDTYLLTLLRKHSSLVQGGAKTTHFFQIIVTLFIFNIKNISTPKQSVINPVLITYPFGMHSRL